VILEDISRDFRWSGIRNGNTIKLLLLVKKDIEPGVTARLYRCSASSRQYAYDSFGTFWTRVTKTYGGYLNTKLRKPLLVKVIKKGYSNERTLQAKLRATCNILMMYLVALGFTFEEMKFVTLVPSSDGYVDRY
jgi:hypothetical protein